MTCLPGMGDSEEPLPFKSDYKLSPFPFQINHIGKLPAVFKYRVIVVVREKVLDTMRLRKTASAVEDECLRNIAGSDKPVLVDFWASWCGPCRALGPVVDQIAQEMADRVTVYKCNVDEQAELATRFGIVSIPTLILFKDGRPAHTMVGNMPKPVLVGELEANL